MTLLFKSRASSTWLRLVSHLGMPLYRNGYALVLSSAATSTIGAVYWIVAAHLYPAREIGSNSAMISAMMFLAGVAGLNMMSALTRFLPVAGRSAHRLVAAAYLTSQVVAVIACLAFLVKIQAWAPEISPVGSLPAFRLWFILGTMAWCIYVLQDSILVGFGLAPWVPVENTLFALVKMALMVFLAGVLPSFGVFASWTLALPFVLLPTNLYLARRFWKGRSRFHPAHLGNAGKISALGEGKVDGAPQGLPSVIQIVRFVAADYLGSLFWLGSTTLLPVLVTILAGPTANAYFYLSWTIAYSLYLVSPNMGASLVVEAALDQDKLKVYSRKLLVQTARIVAPAALLLFFGAGFLLRIFGSEYALNGTLLLRLLALSAIPNIITALSISIARVERNMRLVLTTNAALSLSVLIFSRAFLPILGVTGVGLAWLVSQTLVALGLLTAGQVFHRRFQGMQFTDWMAEPIHLFRRGRVWELNSLFRLVLLLHLDGFLRRLRVAWNHRGRQAWLSTQVPRILRAGQSKEGLACLSGLVPGQVYPTLSNVTVVTLQPVGGSPGAILKLALSREAGLRIEKGMAVMQLLRQDARLAELHPVLPGIIDHGRMDGWPYVIEACLPGIEAQRLAEKPGLQERITQIALEKIARLHYSTVEYQATSREALEGWVEAPVESLRRLEPLLPQALRQAGVFARLEEELLAALDGRSWGTSWVHGDFVPTNLLVAPDGSRVTGIVDWELAQPGGLPALDVIQWLVSIHMLRSRLELGQVIHGLLFAGRWESRDQAQFDAALSGLPGEPLPFRQALLLCWLRHISGNLAKADRYLSHRYWIEHNVENVLRGLLIDGG